MTYYLLPWLLSTCLSNWFFFQTSSFTKLCSTTQFSWSRLCATLQIEVLVLRSLRYTIAPSEVWRGGRVILSFFLTLACTATTAFVRFSFRWSGFLLRSEDRLRWDWDSQMWTGLSFHVLVMRWTVALFAKIFTGVTSWYNNGHIISEVLIPLV